MAANKTLTITMDIQTTFKNAAAEIAQVRNLLKSLNIDSSMSQNLNKSLNEYEATLNKIKGMQVTPSNLNQYIGYVEKLNKDFKTLQQESGIFNNLAKDALTSTDSIKKLEAQINSLKGSLSDDKYAKMQDYFSADKFDLTSKQGRAEARTAKQAEINEKGLSGAALDSANKKLAEQNKLLTVWAGLVTKASNAEKNLAIEEQNVATAAQTQINTLAQSDKSVRNLGVAYDETSRAANEYTQAAAQIAAQQQTDQITSSIARWTGFAIAIRFARDQLRNMKDTYMDLDASLTQIAVVSGRTRDEMWGMIGTYNEMAQRLGATTSQIVESSKLYFQQGRSQAEVMKLVEQTTVLATISELDFTSATNYMTAAINGYKLAAEDSVRVTDVWANLAAKAAVDTQELAVAISKVASLAESAGMSIESTSAFLTKMIETTREAPENLGTALKTIIARFQELKELGDGGILEDGIDANRVEKALKQANVALRDSKGEFRDFDDVILELSKKWDGLSRNQQRYIATIAAGARQQSRFIALVEDYQRNVQLLDIANNSAGAGTAQMATQLTGLQASINRLQAAWEGLYVSLNNGHNVVSGLIDGIANLVNLMGEMGVGFSAAAIAIVFFTVKLVAQNSAMVASVIARKTATAALNGETVATVTAAGASKAFTSALGAQAVATWSALAPILLVIAALGGLIAIIVAVATAEERHNKALQEQSQEYKNLAAEAQQQASGMLSIKQQYEQAYESGGDLTEIQAQLIDQYPDLAKELDLTTVSYTEAIAAMDKYLQDAHEIAALKIADSIATDTELANSQLKSQLETMKSYRQEMESVGDYMDQIAKTASYGFGKSGQRYDDIDSSGVGQRVDEETGQTVTERIETFVWEYNGRKFTDPESLRKAVDADIAHVENQLEVGVEIPLTVEQRGAYLPALEDNLTGVAEDMKRKISSAYASTLTNFDLQRGLPALQEELQAFSNSVAQVMATATDDQIETINKFLEGKSDEMSDAELNYLRNAFGNDENTQQFFDEFLAKVENDKQLLMNAYSSLGIDLERELGDQSNDISLLRKLLAPLQNAANSAEAEEAKEAIKNLYLSILKSAEDFSPELQEALTGLNLNDFNSIIDALRLLDAEMASTDEATAESAADIKESLMEVFDPSDYDVTDFSGLISDVINDIKDLQSALNEGFDTSTSEGLQDFQTFVNDIRDDLEQLGITANEAFAVNEDTGNLQLTAEAYEALVGIKVANGEASIASARAAIAAQNAELEGAKAVIAGNREFLQSKLAEAQAQAAGAEAAAQAANGTIQANNDIITSLNPLLEKAGLGPIASSITSTSASGDAAAQAVGKLQAAIAQASAAEAAIDGLIADNNAKLNVLDGMQKNLQNLGAGGGGGGKGGGGGGASGAAKEIEKYSEALKRNADALKAAAEAEEALQKARYDAIKKVLNKRIELLEEENKKLEEQTEKARQAQENQLEAYKRYLQKRLDALQKNLDKMEKAARIAEKKAAEHELYGSDILNFRNDVVQEYYKDQMALIDEKIKALQDEASEEDRLLKLAQARDAYERAKNSKNRMVLVRGAGFIWQQDQEAVQKAQDDLEKAQRDIDIANLQKEKEKLQEQADLWAEKAKNIGKSTSELEKFDKEYEKFSKMSEKDRTTYLSEYAKAVAENNKLVDDAQTKRKAYDDASDADTEGSIADQINKLEGYIDKVDKLLEKVNMDFDEYVNEKKIQKAVKNYKALYDKEPVENLGKEVTNLKESTKAYMANMVDWGKQIKANEAEIVSLEKALKDWDELLENLGKSTSELNAEQALFNQYQAIGAANLKKDSATYKQAVADINSLAAAWEAANNAQKAYEAQKELEDAEARAEKYAGSFAGGGIVTKTGVADVHGSTTNPEVILNGGQAAALWKFIDRLVRNPYDNVYRGTANTISEEAINTEDNSINYTGCTFQVASNADSIDGLLRDVRVRSPLISQR